MPKSFDLFEIGAPIGALPGRIQSVPSILVFTKRGIALLLYSSWKTLLPGGVILDMKDLIKISKEGSKAVQEFLERGKGITFKGFVPYYEVEEVKLEKRALNRSVVAVKRKDGGEMVIRVIAGKGMGITLKEYIELFRKIAEKIPVKATVELEEAPSEPGNF